MKKFVIIAVGLTVLVGCKKTEEPQPPGDTTDYINAPLLPKSGLYWDMLRPGGDESVKNGGGEEIDGYTLSVDMSSAGEGGANDIFINEIDKTIWELFYWKKNKNEPCRLLRMRHFLYSEDETDITNYIEKMNMVFAPIGIEFDRNNYVGKFVKTSNTQILWDASSPETHYGHGLFMTVSLYYEKRSE